MSEAGSQQNGSKARLVAGRRQARRLQDGEVLGDRSRIRLWQKADPQTSEAAEKCLNEKRKTINGEDILTSMRALGFDNYEGVLKVYLAKFREVSHSLFVLIYPTILPFFLLCTLPQSFQLLIFFLNRFCADELVLMPGSNSPSEAETAGRR